MKDIEVTRAQVGDVIAVPLVNDQGRILLPKGAKLSPAVLSRLAGWGVLSLQIEGDDPDATIEGPETGGTTDEIDHRFAAWESDELMMAIKAVALRHATGG